MENLRALVSQQQEHNNAIKPNNTWKHDRYETEEEYEGGAFLVKVSNLHWNVSEEDLLQLFGGNLAVKSLKIKFDNAGRSLGNANVIFKSKELATKYKVQYDNQLLDGQVLQINLLHEIKAKKSGFKSKKDDQGLNNGLSSRLGPKPVAIESRLGTRKTLDERLGKSIADRLGPKDEMASRLGKKKRSKKRRNKMDVDAFPSSGRNLTSYEDTDVPQFDGQL